MQVPSEKYRNPLDGDVIQMMEEVKNDLKVKSAYKEL